MAVQKRRHSRARGRKRRTHWKLQSPTIVECNQCHQPKMAHHICPNCGFYKDVEVVASK
jgi:large subunit ribosomal protein L32